MAREETPHSIEEATVVRFTFQPAGFRNEGNNDHLQRNNAIEKTKVETGMVTSSYRATLVSVRCEKRAPV